MSITSNDLSYAVTVTLVLVVIAVLLGLMAWQLGCDLSERWTSVHVTKAIMSVWDSLHPPGRVSTYERIFAALGRQL